MIRRGNECQIEYREHMRDGDGTVQLTNFITGPAELCGKGRLFSRLTLNPGCGIGYHVHDKEQKLLRKRKPPSIDLNMIDIIDLIEVGDVLMVLIAESEEDIEVLKDAQKLVMVQIKKQDIYYKITNLNM